VGFMAPKKKKKEDAAEEEDPLQKELDAYAVKEQQWEYDKNRFEKQTSELSQHNTQLEEEIKELRADLERKNEKELNMFEYLSGVVRKRDVEITELQQESKEVKDDLTAHRKDLHMRLDQMREAEKEQRKKIRSLEEKADEVFELRHETSRLQEKCRELEDTLSKTLKKLATTEERVDRSDKLISLMRVVNDDEQCGLAPVITGTMHQQSDSGLIQAEACAALEGIMSRSTAITPRATDPWWVDSVHPVLAAMENHPYITAVQTNASDVLWKLCLQDGNFHDLILKKGGLTFILAALQNHKDDPRLVYSACGALRKLLACRKAEAGPDASLTPRLKKDDSGDAMAIHAADLIVKTMEMHHNSAGAVEGCANALAELSTRGEEIKRAVVGARTISTMFDAMGTHEGSASLRKAGLKFFLSMLENRPPALMRALMSEIAVKERETGLIQNTLESQKASFSPKDMDTLEKIVKKAEFMTGLKEEDDDDNADADVSWIHKKV